jgi:hypothetical protein
MAFKFNEGCTVTEIVSGTGDAAAVAASIDLRLVGFSCRETAAATAEFIIRNGTSASDPPVAFVKLASGQSLTQWFGEVGLACHNGIYIDRVSGTTHIVVYTKN